MLKALLIDLSGTLHVAHEATPGAGAALQALRDAGVFVRFCSNTSKESKRSLLAKMSELELDVREDELFTSLSAVATLVHARNLNPLYLLSPSALEDFPPSSPPYDSVVVGLAPDRFDYATLNEAFRLLSGPNNVPLIATHTARYFRDADQGLSLGPGPFVAALELAAGVKAEVIGKPEESYFRACLRSLERDGIHESDWSNVGMVGDDWRQDLGINFGGVQRFLVRTGKYRAGDEELFLQEGKSNADWVGANFAALVDWLLLPSTKSE